MGNPLIINCPNCGGGNGGGGGTTTCTCEFNGEITIKDRIKGVASTKSTCDTVQVEEYSDTVKAIIDQVIETKDACPKSDAEQNWITGTGNIPSGLQSVTISVIEGNAIVGGSFALVAPQVVTFTATESKYAYGYLPEMAVRGDNFSWIGFYPAS